MKLVLFDIDGTLLLGQGAGARAMERAGRGLHGPNFSLAGIDFGGALDPWIYAQAVARAAVVAAEHAHNRFQEAYLLELASELALPTGSPVILPGVREALEGLSAHAAVTLGLVTGNYALAAAMKLRAVGLDPAQFLVGAFGDDAPTRPELVRLALERWAARGALASADHVVVIGDTPRDVDCAHRNGCRCVGVATGWHSADELVAAGADVVLRDLTDIGPVLELLSLE